MYRFFRRETRLRSSWDKLRSQARAQERERLMTTLYNKLVSDGHSANNARKICEAAQQLVVNESEMERLGRALKDGIMLHEMAEYEQLFFGDSCLDIPGDDG